MPFKRFLVVLLASLVAALVVIALLPRTKLVRASSEIIWIASLYSHKEQIAASILGPRVLVVGGSATLHSFDSVTASQRLGIPVVNFGTHAGMGLAYILDRAERTLRPGDVVLLAPEYEFLRQSTKPNEFTIEFAAFYDRGYIARAPLAYWPNYILGYGVLKSLAEALKVALKGPIPVPADLVQDELGNNRGYTVARSFAKQQISMLTPYTPTPVTAEAREVLAKFAAFAASQHIKVFVIPVSLTKAHGFPGPVYERFLASLPSEYAHVGLSMLGTPAMTFLTLDDIHDIPYHANDRGRAKYTAIVLSMVCRHMHCLN